MEDDVEMGFQQVGEWKLSAKLSQLVNPFCQLHLSSVLIGSFSMLIGQCLPEQLVSILHIISVG